MEKILLPLNAQNWEAVKEFAVDLAKKTRAKIVPLYVVPTSDESSGMGEVIETETVDSALRSLGASQLQSFGEEVGEELREMGIVKRGPLADAVTEAAREAEVDAIVLGNFSTKLSRAVAGSEAERIIDLTDKSVFIVRGEATFPQPGQKMMVPVAAQDKEVSAFEQVEELARTFDLQIKMMSISKLPEETEEALQKLQDKSDREGTEYEVVPASWREGEGRLGSYRMQEADVGLVVLSWIRKGKAGDTKASIFRKFVTTSPIPVLIIQKERMLLPEKNE